jgi:flagellar hook protein FlgE
MPNFSIPLTGLQADNVSLNTIGNNLANLNTVAFKKQDTSFEDLFYQNIGTSGSGDRLQVGVGTKASATASNFTQGSITTTQKDTDIAIDGTGFFIVQNGNVQSLTRAGNFQLDNVGNLITTDGQSVMGYGTANGAVNLNGGLIPLALPIGINEAARATQNITLTTSLDATAATGAVVTSPVKIYDSLGTSHDATVTYTKTSNSTWTYGVSIPGADYTGSTANTTGTLTFDSNGKLVNPTGNVTGVQFQGLADGASDLNFSFNLYSSTSTPVVTQTSGTSNTSATNQDGYTGGTYQSFAVDGDGVVQATFSNGQTSTIGQVAIGTVVNTDGLTRAGSNNYVATHASGDVSIGVANAGGRGSIEGDALEQSNVDISAEFSDLIVAQRAFEANSKTVTTFDTVTQDAIAMIR